jgi:hypothetical protein
MFKKRTIHRHGRELEKEIHDHLPLTAHPTSDLLRDLQEHGVRIAHDRLLTIDQAAYIRQAKTLYCSFYLKEHKKGNFTPIEYLEFHVEGTLGKHIRAFQSRVRAGNAL